MKYDLFEPLHSVTKDQSYIFNKELVREMPNGHILKEEVFNCIAKRDGRDDYLFFIKSLGKYAMVHLTWSKESNPYWPSTEMFDSLDDLKNKWEECYE